MTDKLALAMKYGGFTSLDKVYLEGVFNRLTEEEQLLFLTPPPSVVNAYFAEIYQKHSPQAATDYYLELSRELQLFQTEPSFLEEKPFVRLNLTGKSFGFAYVNEQGLARVFSEKTETITASLLFEIAQIFPHYLVFEEDNRIWMKPHSFDTKDWKTVEAPAFLLTNIKENDQWLAISSLNQDELAEAASQYEGMRYYAWAGREAIVYIKK